MAKKQFKAESKRLLDLMINSIYTHKEIFLRELISNASDAVDKLAYKALTDDQVGLNRDDFQITLTPDQLGRTLTISDNGIGMTRDELEQNLGTIARSGSLQFKQDMDAEKKADVDIIGQFGVGFYSAFMVADKVTVTSRAYGSDEAWCWESTGVDGYTLSPAEKEAPGTDIVLHIKADTEDDKYGEYLEQYRLDDLIKKYSDYIHYPIRMLMHKSRQKERPEDAGEDYKSEWEDYDEWETLNSMVPLWQRPKSEVAEEEYNAFYKEHYGDWEDPLSVIHVRAEGQVEYKAMLYIPTRAPYDFYSRDFEKGLQLYSSGVLIMDKCADLLPDHFRFVRGVVDSPDFSLNISREVLQHTRQLKVIAANLEKKIKAELLRIQKDEREKYETFWASFGRQLKYGALEDYGAHKELLKDLLLFFSSKEGKLTTLAEYRERMAEDQPYVYYASGESVEQIAKLPQVERILDKGYEILYLTDEPDEFIMDALGVWDEKPLKSVSDDDALPQTDEEKAEAEKKAEENKDVLDFVKETLGEKIKEARISKILKSGAVCLTADGPITLEMEKYFARMDQGQAQSMKAQRVLELNSDSGAFAALREALDSDREKAAKYAELLYDQALLIAGLPIEDTARYTELVCSLMQ
ncbi:molecular chaperone HtpG [Pseudoflavonifractor sp. BIOML-A6]|nr:MULTISPECIES: molecular chaperone HtpG [unclassified Pseudoflavonifractor]MTQ95977.1 molecular chaperone HtpG [Pseudoflavonifractor sp. BIOML-A16]MTR04729.1 molecular chaperone HtpG [Pseudoflavonifractor sp. BIOML-A15]MTR31023.1 molecular chaperone HtpG [Pseudoflavonifractor sp. BIOML-A14]MTR71588.1 molecular chaperone HtpG [Pseudoflavonifractor sp. BIOML-A18]MTS62869.1 molecular chaperone HtpG [Pseudoflavonifractor sp. BIOML-A5]MTS71537.1 molecular chaperone HtpG [Pseudoflavonifractor sp.